MLINRHFILIFLLVTGCAQLQNEQKNDAVEVNIIPTPKELQMEAEKLSLKDTLYFYAAQEELGPLYEVLKDEMRSLYNS